MNKIYIYYVWILSEWVDVNETVYMYRFSSLWYSNIIVSFCQHYIIIANRWLQLGIQVSVKYLANNDLCANFGMRSPTPPWSWYINDCSHTWCSRGFLIWMEAWRPVDRLRRWLQDNMVTSLHIVCQNYVHFFFYRWLHLYTCIK